jgi:hypothetical protein
MAEHRPFKPLVEGSIPSTLIFDLTGARGSIVQPAKDTWIFNAYVSCKFIENLASNKHPDLSGSFLFNIK